MQLFLVIVSAVTVRAIGTSSTDSEEHKKAARAVENRHIFSPRMDYDEWKPLGRGDPLKNDPTYDYVPPVLDRVHYWMDPSNRTPDPPLPNPDVLVMGSSQTDSPSSTITATSRLGTMSLLDPFIKFMDASKASLGFSTHTSNYFRPTLNPPYQSVPQHSPPRYNPTIMTQTTDYAPPPPPKIHALQRPPYTMLMPPPPPPSKVSAPTEVPMTSFGTSTQTTTEAEVAPPTITGAVTLASVTKEEVPITTTVSTPNTTGLRQSSIFDNSENLYKPVAITMPESISNETMELLPTTPISRPTQEEMTLPIISIFNDESNHIQDLKSPSDMMVPPPKRSNSYYGFLPTTIRPSTTIRPLTTDPMFKHYKQPNEPVRGPFYLIIQGHSKVKTYGASKNRIKPVSSNEINFDDGKTKHYDSLDYDDNRRGRKLRLGEMNPELDNGEVIKGRPTIELMASFLTKGQMGYSVGEKDSNVELNSEFLNSGKGEDEVTENNDTSQTIKNFVRRKLLATISSTEKNKRKETLDEQQLGLESLIALNEDYNAEDIVNLLLKEEGQGSGFGNLATSLLSRSLKAEEEM